MSNKLELRNVNVFDETLQTVIDMPYEEALRFNKMLCQHLRAEHREKQTETASKFKVGQHVMFYAKKRGHVYGTITVINRVRIKVVTEEGDVARFAHPSDHF